MDQNTIKQTLNNLGIRPEACSIYLAILQRGPLTATQLSRIVNLPKTSTYRFLEILGDKGLIIEKIGTRGTIYRATDPENLLLLLNAIASKTNFLKTNLPGVISSLQTLQIEPDGKTQVRYYEGKKGVSQLIWNSLKAHKFIYGYSTLGRADALGAREHNEYEQELSMRKVMNLIIINDSKYTMEYLNRHRNLAIQSPTDIRFLPEKEFYISNDIMLYNDIFAVCSWHGGEYWGFEAQNQEVVKTQMSIFRLLWKTARRE